MCVAEGDLDSLSFNGWDMMGLGLVSRQSKEQCPNDTSKARVSDGLKMRASVRMTRYLESWGAVKPFAHLQSREGYCTDAMVNGKVRCKVRAAALSSLAEEGWEEGLKPITHCRFFMLS